MKKIICILGLLICICTGWYIISSRTQTFPTSTYLIFNLKAPEWDSSTERRAFCTALAAETGSDNMSGVNITLYAVDKAQSILYSSVREKIALAGGSVQVNVVSDTAFFDMRGEGKLSLYSLSTTDESLLSKDFWDIWHSENSDFLGTGASDLAFDALYDAGDFEAMKKYALDNFYMVPV